MLCCVGWFVWQALVRYEGWGAEWDEWIGLDKDRLVAGGTYTIKAKCWAKITGTMPWWPALVRALAYSWWQRQL